MAFSCSFSGECARISRERQGGMVMVSLKFPTEICSGPASRAINPPFSALEEIWAKGSSVVTGVTDGTATSSKTSFNLELRHSSVVAKTSQQIFPKWWSFMVILIHCGRIQKKIKQNKQKPKSSPPKKENSCGGKTHVFLEESWVLHVKLFPGKKS